MALFQQYQELQITRDSLLEEIKIHWVTPPSTQTNQSWEEVAYVPVKVPGIQDPVMATVNATDYPTVADYVWRLSTTGHVVSTKNKKTHFLHRLLFGKPATHINGNFLDNRRSNLRKSKSRGPGVKDSTSPSKTDL